MQRKLMWALAFGVFLLGGCDRRPESAPLIGPETDSAGDAGTGPGAPARAQAEIGPEGGKLDLSAAVPSLRLEVPAGALASSMTLSGEVPRRALPGFVGFSVELSPTGLHFSNPATLSVRIPALKLPEGVRTHQLVWATEENGRRVPLPTRHLPDGTIEGTTTHFSSFGLIEPCHYSAADETSFSLAGCPSFDPKITTDVPVTLDATAGAVSVLMVFSAGTSPAAKVAVSELLPSHVYTKVEDTFANEEPVLTTAGGVATFTQDLRSNHVVLLQEHPASTPLTAGECKPPLGSWNAGTCTLLQDVESISLDEDGLTLDCGGRRVGDATNRQGIAILTSGHSDVTIRNCDIDNGDFGIFGAHTTNLKVENVSVTSPGLSTTYGINVSDDTNTSLQGVFVRKTRDAIVSNRSQGLLVRDSVVELDSTGTQPQGVHLYASKDVVIRDVTIANPVGQAVSQGYGIGYYTSTNILIERTQLLKLEGAMGAIGVWQDSTASLRHVTIRGADGAGVFADRSSTIEMSDSSITGVWNPFVFTNGSRPSALFHNNIYGNFPGNVYVDGTAGPMELSDTRPSSSTYKEGSYWGHSCAGPLFAPLRDSNAADVADSYPYGAQNAWRWEMPGCNLPAPLILRPASGTFTSNPLLEVSGTTVAGAAVELFANGDSLGLGGADENGDFAIRPLQPLSDGTYSLTVVATLAGRVSPPSESVAIAVDTNLPLAPVISFPVDGSTLLTPSLLVLGTTKPFATVTISEGSTVLASSTADNRGAFSMAPALALSIGSHSIVATALDLAGNSSPPSSPTTFMIAVVSEAAPLPSARGLMEVISIADAPEPFLVGAGARNTLTVEVQMAPLPPRRGHARPETLVVSREIRDPFSGALVSTETARTHVPKPGKPHHPGASSVVAEVSWNGRAPDGSYLRSDLYPASIAIELLGDNKDGANCLHDATIPGHKHVCILDRIDGGGTGGGSGQKPPSPLHGHIKLVTPARFVPGGGSGGAGICSANPPVCEPEAGCERHANCLPVCDRNNDGVEDWDWVCSFPTDNCIATTEPAISIGPVESWKRLPEDNHDLSAATPKVSSVSAARNEFAAFELVVGNTANCCRLQTVDVSLSSLTYSEGSATAQIPPPSGAAPRSITIFREGYVRLGRKSVDDDKIQSCKDWPDVMIPKVDEIFGERRAAFYAMGPRDMNESLSACNYMPAGAGCRENYIPPRENRVFYVEVLVPEYQDPNRTVKTPAGSYKGQLGVSYYDGSSATIKTIPVDIELVVRDFDLPSTSSLKSYFGMGARNIQKAHGIDGFEDGATWDKDLPLRLMYARFLLDHRVTPGFMSPSVNSAPPGSYSSPNWDDFDLYYGSVLNGQGNGSALLAKSPQPVPPLDWTKPRLSGAMPTTIPYKWTSYRAMGRPNYDEATISTMDQSEHLEWANHFKATTSDTHATDPEMSWWSRTTDWICDEPNHLLSSHWNCGLEILWPASNADSWYTLHLNAENGKARVSEFQQKTAVTTEFGTLNSSSPTAPNGATELDDVAIYVPVLNRMNEIAREKYPDWKGAHCPSGWAPEPTTGCNPPWWYQSCMSHGCGGTGPAFGEYGLNYLPSYMVDVPYTSQNRAMEWFSYLYRMEGERYYETANMIEVALTPSSTSLWDPPGRGDAAGNGDGTLLYAGLVSAPERDGPDGTKKWTIGGERDIPLASLRLKMIRAGMQDYEYLKLCEAKDPSKPDDIVKKTFPEPAPQKRIFGAGVDRDKIEAARGELADCITQAEVPPGPDAGVPEPDAGVPPPILTTTTCTAGGETGEAFALNLVYDDIKSAAFVGNEQWVVIANPYGAPGDVLSRLNMDPTHPYGGSLHEVHVFASGATLFAGERNWAQGATARLYAALAGGLYAIDVSADGSNYHERPLLVPNPAWDALVLSNATMAKTVLAVDTRDSASNDSIVFVDPELGSQMSSIELHGQLYEWASSHSDGSGLVSILYKPQGRTKYDTVKFIRWSIDAAGMFSASDAGDIRISDYYTGSDGWDIAVGAQRTTANGEFPTFVSSTGALYRLFPKTLRPGADRIKLLGYENHRFDFIGMNVHANRGFVATADGTLIGFDGMTGDCLRKLPSLPGLQGAGLERPQVAEDGSFGIISNHFAICDYGSGCYPAIPLFYITGF